MPTTHADLALLTLTTWHCCPTGYNDFQLHHFCMHYPALLAEHLLPPGTLMASGKLVALDALLKARTAHHIT
jgi:hypothetical protein